MKKETLGKALVCLLVITISLFSFVAAQDGSWEYSEEELAQAKLGNTIFIIFAIIAALAIIIIYFLGLRSKQKESKKE